MKKHTIYSIILLMACLTLGSMTITGCSKDNNSATSAQNYQINNITDQTIAQGGTAATAWEVKLSGSSQAQVAVAVSGLPAGITATITPTTGIPTFNTAVVFTVSDTVAAGTYTYTITATSSQGNKTYTSHIIVTAVPRCATAVSGYYADSSSFTTNAIVPNLHISPVSGSINRVSILYNVSGTDVYTIYADLYCAQDSLFIPTQAIDNGFGSTGTVSGTGFFSPTSITLNLNETYSGSSYQSSDTYQKY